MNMQTHCKPNSTITNLTYPKKKKLIVEKKQMITIILSMVIANIKADDKCNPELDLP